MYTLHVVCPDALHSVCPVCAYFHGYTPYGNKLKGRKLSLSHVVKTEN